MIQVQTLLKVADNSGGKVVRCLKILKKGTKPRYGKIGDVIVVSVQKIRAKNKLTSKVKKGDVYKAVVVRTSKDFKRPDGSAIRFDKNAAVLLDKQEEPIATRIFGPVTRELRSKKIYENN